MSNTQQPATPAPNLNPTTASGVSLAVVPPRTGALLTEKTRGTDSITFRVPHALKALVNKVIADPRFGFDGSASSFYVQAVGYWLLHFEQAFRDDTEFAAWARGVRALDAVLAIQEPVEAFRERLTKAEENLANAQKSLDYGFNVLRAAVRFVMAMDGAVHDACADMLRASQPMKDLVRALLADEGYGYSDEVDRLQKFMGGAL